MKKYVQVALITALINFGTLLEIRAAELTVETEMNTTYLSNLFMDKSHEAELSLRPSAAVGVQFSDYWSVGYSGELNTYVQHPELILYFQNIYLNLQRNWGEEGENEFFSELSFGSMLNRQDYEQLDLINPRLAVDLSLEPKTWLRTQIGGSVEYRWFYRDLPMSSIDTWVDGSVSFLSSKTRTTLSPRAAFGYRYYPEANTSDVQPLIGVHLGQGLWETAGLQADYTFRWIDEQNELVSQKLTSNQFFFVGEEFLYAGHEGKLGVKQLIGDHFSAHLSTTYEKRVYTGWEALDAAYMTTGKYRRDLRLTPMAGLKFEKLFFNEQTDRVAAEMAIGLDYIYVRQWSNSDWYDTSGHAVTLSIWGAL